MLSTRAAKRHGESPSGFPAVAVFAVKGVKPAQAAACYAAKPVGPAFESAVVGIDLLHVPSPINSNAWTGHGTTFNTGLACCASQGAERLSALLAAVALQSVGLDVPAHALGSAMRARRCNRRYRLRVQRRQFRRHQPALDRRHISPSCRDLIQPWLSHFSLLDDSMQPRLDARDPLWAAHNVSQQHGLRRQLQSDADYC